jgi:hypothetical protein
MKKKYRQCGFCGAPDGYRYIYPIPKEYNKHLFEGTMACAECFPDVRKAQIKEGILERPDPVKLDQTWKE